MIQPSPAADSGARVLVVDSRLPTPDRDGGSLRLFNILTLLVELGCQVTFVPRDPASQPETEAPHTPYVNQLRAAGIQVITAPRIQSLRQHLDERGHEYDVVLLSGGIYNVSSLIQEVRRLTPQASLWFDTVDLAFVREYRHARLLGSRPALQRALYYKQLELRAAALADWTLVVSQAEADVLKGAAPAARVSVLSNVHHIHGSGAPFEARAGIVFIGAYQHRPNLDGLRWFLRDIFPLVRAALPGVRLSVIGADPPPEALALAASDVHIAGHVADLAQVYNACRLSIAPLRFGAGVKGKVLLSLSYGVPVVGTRLAAEGSHLLDGQNVRLADAPEDFARAVVEVYTQPRLWGRLSRAGLETVAQHFSFSSARGQLRQLLAASLPAERAVAAP
ncbi:MAG: glycosyltransferase family 4 protein [Anaerolineales bacterium]